VIKTELDKKANSSDLTSHTGNTTVHVTQAEKNSWNAKSTFSGSYNDLTNKPTIPSAYSLPTASSSTLGGIKVGSNLTISNGVLSAKAGGVGKNVTGTSYTIDGSTVTAGYGAEVFNAMGSNKASGEYSHAEGIETTASGQYSHTEGMGTTASGKGSHAEGCRAIASGKYSHAEGSGDATGDYSHAEGSSTASGADSHAEGMGTASGSYSHAEGASTTASGQYSSSHGYFTTAQGYAQAVFGKCNTDCAGATGIADTTGSIFIVGVGTLTAPKNALRIGNDARCYGASAFGSSGADYAEMFEWQDGNPENEDRRGLFVTLDGEKIRLAQSEDDYIVGVVSANPSVIGDIASDEWCNKFKRDIFGAEIYEEVEVEEYKDEETGEVIPAHTEMRRVLNPEYDETLEYTGRDKRKEWATIGMIGKLVVIDDGSCQVNKYCKVSDNGIAIHSDEKTEYRIVERLDDTHIRIVIK
jgi:hypothetical protein